MNRMLCRAMLCSALIILSSGCVTVANQASNVVPLENVNFARLDNLQTGEACINNVLFLFFWGNNNLSDAAKAGGLTKIQFVESKVESYFVFNKFCTVVYGTKGGGGSESKPRRRKKS